MFLNLLLIIYCGIVDSWNHDAMHHSDACYDATDDDDDLNIGEPLE